MIWGNLSHRPLVTKETKTGYLLLARHPGPGVDQRPCEGIQAENYYDRIGGTVYFVSPLSGLNGQSGISFTELEFTWRLTQDLPE